MPRGSEGSKSARQEHQTSIVRFRSAMITVRIGLSLLRRIVVIVNAIGVRIVRLRALTICVLVEMFAIVGVFDNDLGQTKAASALPLNSVLESTSVQTVAAFPWVMDGKRLSSLSMNRRLAEDVRCP
jgi:hypothetical protein